jgi:hypothetical protein
MYRKLEIRKYSGGGSAAGELSRQRLIVFILFYVVAVV